MTADQDDSGREDQGEARLEGTQRLDKWLWFARLLKSRTAAAVTVQEGKVRVNRARVAKASYTVRPGDVLTIARRGHVLVVKVLAAGIRRGPAPEARQLYELVSQLGARSPVRDGAGALRDRGSGRPTKKDRRLTDRLADQE